MHVTLPELIDMVEKLTPPRAITTQGINPSLCSTPLITYITINSTAYPLEERLDGRFYSAYVRVSTEGQADEGFSIGRQVLEAAHHYARLGRQFKIYSDAGLSGSYPTNDPKMIREMLRKHANRYRHNYTRVFLCDATAAVYSESQKAQMRSYMEAQIQAILAGENDEDNTLATILPRQLRATFRPALTLLLQDLPQIVEVAITDLTRLCRNQAVQQEIASRLLDTDVKIVGMIEQLDYLNQGEGFGSKLQAYILCAISEQYLSATSLNSLRGIKQMLDHGLPYGRLPSFLERHEDGPQKGRAKWKAGCRDALKRFLELFMTPDESSRMRSAADVRRILIQEGWQAWDNREFADDNLHNHLRNPILMGYQVTHGLRIKVLDDPLLDEEGWERLQARVEYIRANHARAGLDPRSSGHLTTGVLRCICGAKMYRKESGQCKTYIYSCYEVHNKTVSHVQYGYANLNAFVIDLIQQKKDWFLSSIGSNMRIAELQKQHTALHLRLLDAKVALSLRTKSLEHAAAKQTQALGFHADEDSFHQIVQAIVARNIKEDKQAVMTLEKRLVAVENDLSILISQDRMRRVADLIDNLNFLTPQQQNEIVCTIFSSFQSRGQDPEVEIVPVLITGDELPPIKLRYKSSNLGNGKYRHYRRLPGVEEYLAIAVDAGLNSG